MRGLLLLLMTSGIVAGGFRAQTLLSFPLPAGFPADWDAEVFTDGEAVAIKDAGGIRVLTGFDTLAAVSVQLHGFGAATPSGPWQRLSDSRAIYASNGGELVLVTGLPAAPVIVPTTISGTVPGWIVVNDSTAVDVDASLGLFRVLRHSAGGATLYVVPSAFAISGGPYEPGRIDNNVLAAMGPGTDASPGTADDLILRLRGLAGSPAGFQVTSAPVPAGSQPLGFGVSTTGVGFYWEPIQAWVVPVTLVRNLSDIPTFLPITASPPVLQGPVGLTGYGVIPGVGDTVLAWEFDDAAIGNVYAIIQHVSTFPVAAGSFARTDEIGFQIAENEVAAFWGLAPSGPQTYTIHRFNGPGAGGTISQTRFVPSTPGQFVKPNPGTLFLTSTGFQNPSHVQVVTDVFGSSGAVSLPVSGHFAFADPVILGPGRVAVFLATAAVGPSTHIDVISVPSNCRVGAGSSYSQSTFQMGILPAVPVIGAPLRFEFNVLWNPAPAIAWLGVASRTSGPIAFSPGSQFQPLLHLDPLALVAIVPIPLSSGWAELTVPGNPAPPPLSLLGIPIYFQSFVQISGGWAASDALLLTIG